jgi:hypothetical protein
MKLIKKIAAASLLTIGLPIFILATIQSVDSSQSPEDREEALAVLCILGLPPTGLGGWLAWGLYRQERIQKLALKQEERDRINSTFFRLIEAGNGRITILRFAQETKLSGEEARRFLDQKAIEFDATFETDDKGGIYYYFQS